MVPAWNHDISKITEEIVQGDEQEKLSIPKIRLNTKLAIRVMRNENAPSIQLNCEDVKATVKAFIKETEKIEQVYMHCCDY